MQNGTSKDVGKNKIETISYPLYYENIRNQMSLQHA